MWAVAFLPPLPILIPGGLPTLRVRRSNGCCISALRAGEVLHRPAARPQERCASACVRIAVPLGYLGLRLADERG